MILRFTGSDISPKSFTIKELSKLLEKIDKSIISLIHKNNPTVNINNLGLSLVNIYNKSNTLCLEPVSGEYDSLYKSNFHTLGNSISAREYTDIDQSGIDLIKEIYKITLEKECNARFQDSSDESSTFATISPNDELQLPQLHEYTEYTSIYGELIRIGGIKEPSAWLTHRKGHVICTGTKQQYQKLAQHLFNIVGLKGIATWSFEEQRILKFKIESIVEYGNKSPSEVMKILREKYGKFWSELGDIDELFKEIRSR